MESHLQLLRSICYVHVMNIMNRCESNIFPKERIMADYEFDFMNVCLWHTHLWSSSRRKYVALKLEKLGLISIVKQRDYSPICVRFSNGEYNKIVYDWCKKSMIGFEYISGNGFNSYPQFTLKEDGKDEVKRLSEILFNKVCSDYNIALI